MTLVILLGPWTHNPGRFGNVCLEDLCSVLCGGLLPKSLDKVALAGFPV